MELPERFQIDMTEPAGTWTYSRPHTATVSYHNPYKVTIHPNGYCNNVGMLSETAAIRRELSEIRNDIGRLRCCHTSPTYYVAQPTTSTSCCPECIASATARQYEQNPVYCYEPYVTMPQERPYTAGPSPKSGTGLTTYRDHYRGPEQYGHKVGRPRHPRNMNEMQTQTAPSSQAQHPRDWVPGGSKNSYPHRRWNLSIPHPEP